MMIWYDVIFSLDSSTTDIRKTTIVFQLNSISKSTFLYGCEYDEFVKCTFGRAGK